MIANIWREDYRLGGIPVLRLCPEDEPEMQLSELALLSVAFVGIKVAKKFIPAGTGVFVTVGDATYLVTCRHVIQDCGRAPIYVQVNSRDGVAQMVHVSGWQHHPDESVDASAAHWPGLDGAEIVEIPDDTFGTGENLKAQNLKVGVGDDVQVIGLFSRYSGTTVNEPLVRRGSIAMIPRGRIAVTKKKTAQVNLVEVRSIGGMSGSPVFLHYRWLASIGPVQPSGVLTPRWIQAFFLWGIVSGHWDIRLPHTTLASKKHKPTPKDKHFGTGIAMVVPIERLVETVSRPKIARHVAQVADHKAEAGYASTQPPRI